MADAGSVVWNLDIDDKKFKAKLSSSKSDVSNFGDHTEKESNRLAGAMATAGKAFVATATIVAAAGAAAFGKFVIGGGISRALNIEDAQAKLKGLGHDVKAVQTIMESALAAVRGTAFALDEAATTAATAVAAGIKPGKDLTKYLTLTADAATIAGTSMSEMGAIINKTTTSGKAMRDNLNQLAERGLPIFQWLQKEYGVTAQALDDMIFNGEISAERFRNAIANNISGAALASGNTTRGAFENMKAAMARVGAAIVKDIMPKVRDAFGGLTTWLDENSGRIVAAFGRVGDFIGGVARNIVVAIHIIQDVFRGWDPGALMNADTYAKWAGFVGVINAVRQAYEYLRPKVEELWVVVKAQLIPELQRLWREVLQPLLPVIGTLLVIALGLFIDTLRITIAFISETSRVTGIATHAMVGAFQWLGGVISNVLQWGRDRLNEFKNLIGGMPGFIQAVLNPIASILFNPFGTAFELIKRGVYEVMDAINALKRAASDIKSGSANLGQRILDPLKLLHRQAGGPVSSNVPYIVGEAGPEIFMPSSSGEILPNSKLGGGMSNQYHIGTINIASEVDGERWLRKLTRNQEVVDNGLVPSRNTI